MCQELDYNFSASNKFECNREMHDQYIWCQWDLLWNPTQSNLKALTLVTNFKVTGCGLQIGESTCNIEICYRGQSLINTLCGILYNSH